MAKYEKYILQLNNGNFIKLVQYDTLSKTLEIQEWDDISHADMYEEDAAIEHLNGLLNKKEGFWKYENNDEIDLNEIEIKEVTIIIE